MKLPAEWSRSATYQATRFFPLTDLRELRRSEQVAAVCFRMRSGQMEFLLVQTRGGRWTFPKGCAEPGLTHAQAAALEAFEEAGVHGRIEEAAFTRYVHHKRRRTRNAGGVEMQVTAHLCEVLSLDPPQESHRNPTWFPAEKAKRRLRDHRTATYGVELARVVDLAVLRIRQLRAQLPVHALKPAAFIDGRTGQRALRGKILAMPRRTPEQVPE